MSEILLFHHVQGLTPGVHELADRLRAGGHTVHTPDLYDGRTFAEMSAGAAFAQAQTDRDEVVDRLVAELPDALVYAGISSGVMSAQRLAQTRSGAVGAVLLEACLPVSGEWAIGPWPDGVPVQVHGMDDDEFFAHEGDLDAARGLVASTSHAELFTYPGSAHLFVDSSLPSYDAAATDLVVERVLAMLARL